MSMPPLNLASRPFRNERLPALLLALGFTAVGAVTIKHALAVRSLMPGRTSGLARQVAELENERERLRQEQSQLRAPRPEAAVLAQWTLLKDLVDGRTFSWSGLFALLEETLPKGVRLISITPKIEKGERTVYVTGVARTNEDLLELIRVLEERAEFEEVLPEDSGLNDQNLVEFRAFMKYRPAAAPAVVAAANVTATASPSPSPDAAASPAASPSAPSSPAAASAAAPPAPAAAEATPSPASPRPAERRLSGRAPAAPEKLQ
jgi:Tfp pilus assembly protein PilN